VTGLAESGGEGIKGGLMQIHARRRGTLLSV
jgi:hypothetical protein